MTLKDIEAAEAGPRLDALAAQHALGWSVNWDDEDHLARWGSYSYTAADGKRRAIPSFSHDALAAEALVQVIRDVRDGHFTLFAFSTGWKALGHTPDLLTGFGEHAFLAGYHQLDRLAGGATRSLAICRCALRTFVLDDEGPTEEEMATAAKEWEEATR